MDGTDAARTLGLVALQIAECHLHPERDAGSYPNGRRVRNSVQRFVGATRPSVVASIDVSGVPL